MQYVAPPPAEFAPPSSVFEHAPAAGPAPAQVMREPEPEPAPRQEQRRVEAPAMARIDPKELLSEAGLQMVETDSSKAKYVPVESKLVQLGRPRRERPVAPTEDAELNQVETRNK